MSSKLPSFIRLPGYNKFEYKPRHYDPNQERRETKEKRIKFRVSNFKSDSPISDQFKRKKTYSRKKIALITTIIRFLIILLLLAIFYLVFYGVTLMK